MNNNQKKIKIAILFSMLVFLAFSYQIKPEFREDFTVGVSGKTDKEVIEQDKRENAVINYVLKIKKDIE